MAKYLITGGAGFIGSHLAEHLVKNGQEVVVLDNLSTGKRENLKPAENGPGKLEFVLGDIAEFDTCMEVMSGCDYVLHQAALPSVARSVDNPIASNHTNLTGGLNLMDAARRHGVKRMVMASSSSCYGNVEPLDAPKMESMPLRPLSPYAVTKASCELYAKVFYQVYGLETVCMRYFNVFGPRQDPESAYAAVIPKFIFALTDGISPTVHGDGLQSRDFTYIDNVIEANMKALTAPKAPGEVFNVAYGQSYNLLELLDILQELLGTSIEPEFGPVRTGDVRYSLADLSKARKLLGYDPQVDFKQGLAKLVELVKKGEYLAA